MHQKQIVTSGVPIEKAAGAAIFIHGRGATAADIITLAQHLQVKDLACLAPQATNYTWYPYSFLAPQQQNEPWLSSALTLLKEMTNDLLQAGFSSQQIYFIGFSQGACLTLEFVTRNAQRWGGVAAFTGGLIGETIDEKNYSGNFDGTPIFIGSSDPDPHVPVARVKESVALIASRGAVVTERIYKNLGHTISQEEIDMANQVVFSRQ